MIIGNLQVNPIATFELGKEQFFATFRGKADCDLEEAWKAIEKAANPGKVNLKKKSLK